MILSLSRQVEAAGRAPTDDTPRLSESLVRVCEELNPSTALAEERVQVQDIFSELRPVSKEKVCGSARSSGPEWNVARVNHSRVAALTLHSEARLRSRFGQDSRRELRLSDP